MNTLPFKNIASFKEGEYAKVKGKVLAINDEVLISPLSKRKCVFYSLTIEQKTRRGKNNFWKKIRVVDEFQDFLVDKNGDSLLISLRKNPVNYTKHLINVNKFVSDSSIQSDAYFKEYLEQQKDIRSLFLASGKKLRYSEVSIAEGDEVLVAGLVKRSAVDKPIKGYSYSKIASFEGLGKQKVIITNLPSVMNASKNRR